MEGLLIVGLIAIGFLILYWINNRGPVLTGPATIVSRRVEPAKYAGRYRPGVENAGWNYLVTFRLADGEEIELYTFENIYNTLKEGTCGQLTWHQDTLSDFIAE